MSDAFSRFANAVYNYVSEYAAKTDPRLQKELGVGFGHAANILEAISISERLTSILQRTYAALNEGERDPSALKARLVDLFTDRKVYLRT